MLTADVRPHHGRAAPPGFWRDRPALFLGVATLLLATLGVGELAAGRRGEPAPWAAWLLTLPAGWLAWRFARRRERAARQAARLAAAFEARSAAAGRALDAAGRAEAERLEARHRAYLEQLARAATPAWGVALGLAALHFATGVRGYGTLALAALAVGQCLVIRGARQF